MKSLRYNTWHLPVGLIILIPVLSWETGLRPDPYLFPLSLLLSFVLFSCLDICMFVSGKVQTQAEGLMFGYMSLAYWLALAVTMISFTLSKSVTLSMESTLIGCLLLGTGYGKLFRKELLGLSRKERYFFSMPFLGVIGWACSRRLSGNAPVR